MNDRNSACRFSLNSTVSTALTVVLKCLSETCVIQFFACCIGIWLLIAMSADPCTTGLQLGTVFSIHLWRSAGKRFLPHLLSSFVPINVGVPFILPLLKLAVTMSTQGRIPYVALFILFNHLNAQHYT